MDTKEERRVVETNMLPECSVSFHGKLIMSLPSNQHHGILSKRGELPERKRGGPRVPKDHGARGL